MKNSEPKEKAPTSIVEEEVEDAIEEVEEETETLSDEEVEDVLDESASVSTTSDTDLDISEELVLVEERLYVVPFRSIINVPLKRRAKKAVIKLRKFAARHMKSEYVSIHPKVNEQIWSRGISKPPRKIRVRIGKDAEGVVHVLPSSA